MNKTLGEQLSPILSEIEDTLLDHQINDRGAPKFTDEGFKAVVYIFSQALLDKAWDRKKLDLNKGGEMGQALRLLIKTYTGMDMWEEFKN